MNSNYIINRVRGFDFSTYVKAMKVRFGTIEDFKRVMGIQFEADPNRILIEEEWDNIEPLTIQEAFGELNQERRRVLFSCIGPERLFKSLSPKLIDRTVLNLKNKTWDKEGNKETIHWIEDVYELYELPVKDLFKGVVRSTNDQLDGKLRVVRCWCTTTGREYWIFVEDRVAMSPRWRYSSDVAMTNAIQAIAWTFRIGVPKDDIEEIYRQGDCLIVKAKDDAEPLSPAYWYHLDEQTYRTKLVAQS